MNPVFNPYYDSINSLYLKIINEKSIADILKKYDVYNILKIIIRYAKLKVKTVIIKYLVRESKLNINAQDFLEYAIFYQKWKTAKLLIFLGANVNTKNFLANTLAAGKLKISQELINMKFNVTKGELEEIMLSVIKKDGLIYPDIFLFLIANKFNLDINYEFSYEQEIENQLTDLYEMYKRGLHNMYKDKQIW